MQMIASTSVVPLDSFLVWTMGCAIAASTGIFRTLRRLLVWELREEDLTVWMTVVNQCKLAQLPSFVFGNAANLFISNSVNPSDDADEAGSKE